ncbi:DUF3299 domain-containing protein [Luteolibacter pohnpeiensis]|nr:DUF3299 domain-containing protein [Luteolibacter pohnpeiensis]
MMKITYIMGCLPLLLSNVSAKANDGSVKIVTFKLLGLGSHPDGRPPIYPRSINELAGKKVKITGFVSPYDDPNHMIKLMLTEGAVGCFFCNPPEENGVVLVRFPKNAKPLKWDSDTLTIEGVFHLMGSDKNDDESNGFMYIIDDARVVK